MNEVLAWVVILISLFLIILTFRTIFSYYSMRASLSKREKAIRESFELSGSGNNREEMEQGEQQQWDEITLSKDVRKTTPAETIGLRRLYGLDIAPEAQVYSVTGALDHLVLSHRNGESNQIWIGGINIQLAAQIGTRKQVINNLDTVLYPYLNEEQSVPTVEQLSQNYHCEFVLYSDKAYPVSINNLSVGTLFDQETDSPLHKATFRTSTKKERCYLYQSSLFNLFFLIPVMLFCYLTLTFDLTTNSETALLWMLLITLVSFLWPKRDHKTAENDICKMVATLEAVPTRFGTVKYCRVLGTKSRILIPLHLRKLFREKQQVAGDFELFYKGAGVDSKAGKIVAASLFDQNYQLENSLFFWTFANRKFWWARIVTLILSAATALSIMLLSLEQDKLSRLVYHTQHGPYIIESAADSLNENIKRGSLVEFKELLAYQGQWGWVSGYKPLSSVDDYLIYADNFKFVDELYNQWLRLGEDLAGSIRYRNGRPFSITQKMDMNKLVCTDGALLQEIYNRRSRVKTIGVENCPSRTAFYEMLHQIIQNEKESLRKKAQEYYRSTHSQQIKGYTSYPLLGFWGIKPEFSSYQWQSANLGDGPRRQMGLAHQDPFYVGLLSHAYQLEKNTVLNLNGRYYVSSRSYEGDKNKTLRLNLYPYSRYLVQENILLFSLLLLLLGSVLLLATLLLKPR